MERDKELIKKYSSMIDLDMYKKELNNFPQLIWPKYELRVVDFADGMHVRLATFVKDPKSNYYMPVVDNYLSAKFSGIDFVKKALEEFENKCSLVITYGIFNKRSAVKLEKYDKMVK